MQLPSFLNYRSDNSLIRLLSLIGMLLAAWVAAMQHGRISVDSVLYLEAARLFAVGDWHGALALYNWPLFSLLIAVAHHLTGFSLHNSAHLLATIFFGIATWSFLTLIKEAGGDRWTILSGALLLFSSSYIVGDVLPMIMRDQGFWAFYLLSLVLFLRFLRDVTLRHALLWQGSAMLATLFRVEGVTFLALLPLVLAFRHELTWRVRCTALVKAYAVPLLGIAALVCEWLFVPALDVQKALGRLVDMRSSLVNAYQQVTVGLAAKAHVYGETVLGSFMADYAMSGLLLTLLAVIASKVLGASGWLAFVLAAARPCQAVAPVADAKKMLYWVAGINLLNLVVIILSVFLLAQRYVVALGFIILVFAAFSLAGLYRSWRTAGALALWQKGVCVAIIGVVGFCLIKNLLQRDPTNNYEQAAVAWVQQNMPANSTVFYDDERLRYYAHAPWGKRKNDWEELLEALRTNPVPYNYLVLHIKHRHPEKLELLTQMRQYRPLKEFRADNGDRIVIMVGHPLQLEAIESHLRETAPITD